MDLTSIPAHLAEKLLDLVKKEEAKKPPPPIDLVKTASGSHIRMPTHKSVAGGLGASYYLAQKDERGYPRFMLPEDWQKLSDAEKAKFSKKIEEVGPPDPKGVEIARMKAQNDLLTSQLAEMQKQIAALAAAQAAPAQKAGR